MKQLYASQSHEFKIYLMQNKSSSNVDYEYKDTLGTYSIHICVCTPHRFALC